MAKNQDEAPRVDRDQPSVQIQAASARNGSFFSPADDQREAFRTVSEKSIKGAAGLEAWRRMVQTNQAKWDALTQPATNDDSPKV